MRREGNVFYRDQLADIVWQDEDGYGFQYNQTYPHSAGAAPVSLTLPMTEEPYLSKTMLPSFDGLIPAVDAKEPQANRCVQVGSICYNFPRTLVGGMLI